MKLLLAGVLLLVSSMVNAQLVIVEPRTVSVTIDAISVDENGVDIVYTSSVAGPGNGVYLSRTDISLIGIGPLDVNSEMGLVLLSVLRWVRRDPTLSTASIIVGKTATFSTDAPRAVTVN